MIYIIIYIVGFIASFSVLYYWKSKEVNENNKMFTINLYSVSILPIGIAALVFPIFWLIVFIIYLVDEIIAKVNQ